VYLGSVGAEEVEILRSRKQNDKQRVNQQPSVDGLEKGMDFVEIVSTCWTERTPIYD
jgi:hypothetical protein